MKKIVALILAALLALSVAGCGGAPAPSESGQDLPKQTLTLATESTFPPYEFYEGEKIVGIDIEIAEMIAEKLDMELKVVDTNFDSIIPGVQAGKYDIGMAGMTVTEDRLTSVNFSTSYAKGVQVVIVKDNAIKSVDDLFADGANNVVAVQEGTTGDIYATGDIEDAGLGSIQRFKSGAEAVQSLIAGKADCVIIDNEPAKAYVAANEGQGLSILDSSYADEDYAIAVAKGNTELLDKVNIALGELIKDGSVQKIVDKYISAK